MVAKKSCRQLLRLLHIYRMRQWIIPSQKYDVTKDAEHLVNARRLIDALDDRRQKICLETRTSRPSYTVLLPLQQTMKCSRCKPQRHRRRLLEITVLARFTSFPLPSSSPSPCLPSFFPSIPPLITPPFLDVLSLLPPAPVSPSGWPTSFVHTHTPDNQSLNQAREFGGAARAPNAFGAFSG